MKINNFRGDLTDVSAKKEALKTSRCSVHAKDLVAGDNGDTSARLVAN